MGFTYTTRKDGRLMKRVKYNGKIKSLYADNPKDLERQYIELKYNENLGIVADDENMTVSIWAKKWLAIYKKDVSKNTYKMYESIIRLYINPYIGNIRLSKLKQNDIINLLNKLEEKHVTKVKNNTLITIKAILNTAIENDYLYRNVALGVKLKRHKSAEKTPLTDATIEKIKKLAKDNDNAFMILFLIYTGLRRGEIIPLQYKDIDIQNKFISVNKAVYIDTNQPEIKDTKNHENRIVPIFNVLFDKLKEMKDTHNANDFVFPNKHNGIMSQTSIRRKLENVLNQLNKDIKKEDEKINFTLHQLRHTFACILHKAGIDVKQSQQWTGHKDIRVLLELYTHLDSQDNQKSIEKVNRFLS